MDSCMQGYDSAVCSCIPNRVLYSTVLELWCAGWRRLYNQLNMKYAWNVAVSPHLWWSTVCCPPVVPTPITAQARALWSRYYIVVPQHHLGHECVMPRATFGQAKATWWATNGIIVSVHLCVQIVRYFYGIDDDNDRSCTALLEIIEASALPGKVFL